MRFIKCPRCELNYIPEDEEYCPVCKREIKGERQEEPVELCSICNENPVMPGRDVCFECYKELTQQQSMTSGSSDEDDRDVEINMNEVAEMNDIDLTGMRDSDIPSDLSEHLSLEDEQDKELELDEDLESEYEDN